MLNISFENNRKGYKLICIYINMSDDKKPRCSECNSTQIRTTSKYRICIRCGFKEELE